MKVIISLFAVLAAFQFIFGPYLPVNGTFMGHDYALYLPGLLTGYYWFLNNALYSAPWFSPSQCGGLPFFPNLNSSLYYSLPQFLTIWMTPIAALRITFLTFAGMGFMGSYLLLRRRFGSSIHAAIAGGVFFAFNGFFVYRFLIGHLTFHSFALVPLLALFLLPSLAHRKHRNGWSEIVFVLLAALTLTYMFQSGMVHALPPVFFAVVGIFVIHGWLFGQSRIPWSRLIGAAVVALFLCASRLVASIALLSQFPRDFYPLPGFKTLGQTVLVALNNLFASVPMQLANDWWAHSIGRMGRHEYEFGVTVVPLLLLVTAGVWLIRRYPRFDAISAARVIQIFVIAVILSLPILLNWYEVRWNAFLKQLPYFRNSGNLLRWFCLYIPLVVLGAALALDRVGWLRRYGALPAVLAVIAVIIINATTDRTYYRENLYDATDVQNAYIKAHATQSAYPITYLSGATEIIKTPNGFKGPNDLMTRGVSRIRCYQPIFGYRLEQLPVGQLRDGPAMAERNGKLNVNNPACFLYPEANSCKPGDRFTTEQAKEAQSFLEYRPFRFRRPAIQHLADGVTIISLVLVGILLPLSVFMVWRRSADKLPNG